MPERSRFSIVEASSDRYTNFIDLNIDNRESVSFTGSELIFASTTPENKVVVKIPSDNSRAKHEWEGLKKAYLANVSVPMPVALINYNTDRLAVVSAFVQGDNLYYHPDSCVKVELGRQIKTMHKKAWIDGKTWESSDRNTFIYYDKHIFHWTSGKLKELQTDSKTISLINKLSGTMIDFCNHIKPVFNHNDLHDGQVIINKEKHPTIIDFGNWTEESWLNDIGYHLFHLIRTDREKSVDFTNFLHGYLDNQPLSYIEKSVLGFYLLFISARALNYFSINQSTYLPIAKETHKKVLHYLDNETIWKNY